MANVYFGTVWNGLGPKNGNWTDVRNFYTSIGGFDYAQEPPPFLDPTPLGRLPIQSDTVYFNESILLNFPSSWSGTTVDLKLGSQIVNATGTWTGDMAAGGNDVYYNGSLIYGTKTQPILSGNLIGNPTPSNNLNASYKFYGGIITSNVTPIVTQTQPIYLNLGSSNGYYDVNGSNTTFISANTITGAVYINVFGGSTLSANLNTTGSLLFWTNSQNNNPIFIGSITTSGDLTIQDDAKPTILNCPTISCGGLQMYGTASMPQTTQITCSNNAYLGRNNGNTISILSNYTVVTPSSLNITCAKNLSIRNSNVSGSFSFVNSGIAKTLTVDYGSVIAQDISSLAINCYDYKIISGTFTNANNWVFGNTTTPAKVYIGAENHIIAYLTLPTGGPYWSFFTEKFSTSKNITIYTNTTKSVTFYSPTNYPYYQPDFNAFCQNYGTITGLISIIPTTGGTLPYISVGGGKYWPTKTISSSANGSNYQITQSDFPKSYGFGLYSSSAYAPIIYVNNLPSGIDVLATSI